MLENGKHVLVEKPTAMTADQHEELIELARGKGLLFMTDFWTRFFPAFKYARQVIENGAIGEVLLVTGDMAFQAVNNATDRFMNDTLGGGSLMDMGCYQTSFATLFAANAGELGYPSSVHAEGELNELGVDVSSSTIMTWRRDNQGLRPVQAVFTTSFLRPSSFETEIIGSLGRYGTLSVCPSETRNLSMGDGCRCI